MSSDLLAEVERRLDDGDPRSAHRLARKAYEAGRASGSPETRWRAAHLLGEALYVVGDIAGARIHVGEALRLSQASGDPAALGADLNLLGIIEIGEGRLDEAVFLLRRSYDLRVRAGGPDSSDAIESLNNLAGALWRRGEEDEALELHEDALRRCDRALGEHRRTAETLNALAVKLDRRPESMSRARELQERALAVAEAAQGPDSALVAQLAANVAAQLMSDGDLDRAAQLIDRALALHERHYGPESRWTAHVVKFQGDLAYAQGRYDDARSAYERLLVIRVRELGPEDPGTIAAATSLWSTLDAMARSDPDAGTDARDEASALELVCLALDPELESAIPGGVRLDREQAAEQLRRVAARTESRRSSEEGRSAALARTAELVERADGHYLEGDLAAAASALREAIAVLEGVSGPDDTALVEPLRQLIRVHWAARRESEVLPLLRRIASTLSAAYGELHPLAVGALADVYWQERREHGSAGGRDTAARIDAALRALGKSSDIFEPAHALLATARQAAEGTEPADPPLSARRERFLDEPSPLVGELLGDLDETSWSTLEHAYGPAVDTPLNLRLLLADDEWVRRDALERLGESLLGQGSTYSATAPALAVVRRLAGDERVPGRVELARFLDAAPRV